ncbi:hypothetical protein C8Q77DRAFT_580791 [Trametes polyzona]|nr:hypothetical protein C8Q77DRAFT_580791 [Trametes polyzona]
MCLCSPKSHVSHSHHVVKHNLSPAQIPVVPRPSLGSPVPRPSVCTKSHRHSIARSPLGSCCLCCAVPAFVVGHASLTRSSRCHWPTPGLRAFLRRPSSSSPLPFPFICTFGRRPSRTLHVARCTPRRTTAHRTRTRATAPHRTPVVLARIHVIRFALGHLPSLHPSVQPSSPFSYPVQAYAIPPPAQTKPGPRAASIPSSVPPRSFARTFSPVTPSESTIRTVAASPLPRPAMLCLCPPFACPPRPAAGLGVRTQTRVGIGGKRAAALGRSGSTSEGARGRRERRGRPAGWQATGRGRVRFARRIRAGRGRALPTATTRRHGPNRIQSMPSDRASGRAYNIERSVR